MGDAARSVLLLACCIWNVNCQAQNGDQGGVAKGDTEPIVFSTKAKDSCTMTFLNQAELTKLRVSCKNDTKSYWCEYQGKPTGCRPYSNNPRHYFNQIMWEMRKLQNACQGPQAYRPQMCRSAGDQAQMVFHRAWPRIQKKQQLGKALPKQQSGKDSAKKPVQPRKPARPVTPRPTEAAQSPADKLAEEYCWSSVQGICSYVIGWFQ